MNHAIDGEAAARMPVAGWTLHSGGRQFGPLTDDELRRFFSSGVVKIGDTVGHAELGLTQSASEAALRLQVAAPSVASMPAPALPPVRHIAMEQVDGSGRRPLVLALLLVAAALLYWWIPRMHGEGNPRGAERALVADANRLEDAKDWQAARDHAQSWTRKEPTQPHAWLYLGRALVGLGQSGEAERAFGRGLELSPGDAVLLENLASLCLDQNRYEQAEQNFHLALRANPRSVSAWNMLGMAYSLQGRHADALAALGNATRLDPGDAHAWTEIGYENYADGRMREALAPLEKAIALGPESPRAGQILEAVKQTLAGRPANPIGRVDTPASARDPAAPATASAAAVAVANNPPPATPAPAPEPATATAGQANSDLAEAKRLESAGDWVAAREHAQRWSEREPANANSWLYLGRALHSLGQLGEAQAALERARERAPNDLVVLINLANAYRENVALDHARETYLHAIEVDSSSYDAWHQLGFVYVEQFRDQDAITAWQTAARLAPRSTEPLLLIGERYLHLGNKRLALEWLERARALEPGNGDALKLIDFANRRL